MPSRESVGVAAAEAANGIASRSSAGRAARQRLEVTAAHYSSGAEGGQSRAPPVVAEARAPQRERPGQGLATGHSAPHPAGPRSIVGSLRTRASRGYPPWLPLAPDAPPRAPALAAPAL